MPTKVYSAVAKKAAKNLVPLYKAQQQDPDFRARFNTGDKTGLPMNPAIPQTEAMRKIHAGLDLAASQDAKKETLAQALARLAKRK